MLRALDANRPGFDTFVIATADTVIESPRADLLANPFRTSR